MNCDQILGRLADGTLIRESWTGTDSKGRQTACLLAVIVPKCGVDQSAYSCPSEVMPAWLAHLTPWIDDAGTIEAWPAHIREYARLSQSFGRLTTEPEVGRRALIGSLRAIMVEAVCHGDPDGTVSAVLALLDRDLAGDCPTTKQYRTASTNAAVNAANAAAYAATAAANAANAAIARSAEAVSIAAGRSAKAASIAAGRSAKAAADWMITGIFVAISDSLGLFRV